MKKLEFFAVLLIKTYICAKFWGSSSKMQFKRSMMQITAIWDWSFQVPLSNSWSMAMTTLNSSWLLRLLTTNSSSTNSSLKTLTMTTLSHTPSTSTLKYNQEKKLPLTPLSSPVLSTMAFTAMPFLSESQATMISTGTAKEKTLQQPVTTYFWQDFSRPWCGYEHFRVLFESRRSLNPRK